jgi:hypothetical protein
MMTYQPTNVGEFKTEYNNFYTYRKTDNPWALANGFEFEIDVYDNNIRFANVKKTVAIVCVDEDENGAVVEKWKLKKNYVFPK